MNSCTTHHRFGLVYDSDSCPMCDIENTLPDLKRSIEAIKAALGSDEPDIEGAQESLTEISNAVDEIAGAAR